MKITTKTGAVYRIDEHRHWTKERDGRLIDGPWSVWALQQNIDPIDPETFDVPWRKPELWEHVAYPEVGKHMYIHGRDSWYITTEIVSVEDE